MEKININKLIDSFVEEISKPIKLSKHQTLLVDKVTYNILAKKYNMSVRIKFN